MGEKKEARALIEQLGDLPALPSVVSEVLQLTEDPSADTADVCKAVEKDPALAAKVLRVSNSSYYGMKQYVGTLKLALVILGAREVRNIVLGISVFDTLSSEDDFKFAQKVWNDSLEVAGLNKMIATEMGLGFQGEEFISGLLCDIGKMALLWLRGDLYRTLVEDSESNIEALMVAERKLFGLTHGEVASALALRWNLPQTLTDALWHQYPAPGRSLKEARDPRLAALLRIARRAANDRFDGDSTPKCLREAEAWEVLSNARHVIPESERKTLLGRFVKELAKMPPLPI